MKRSLRNIFFSLDALLLFFLSFSTIIAFAQDAVAPQDFLSQVLKFIQSWGGIPMMAKVAGVILLLVASMKVSFLKPYWDKLGSLQAWVAPILGLIAGILGLGSGGAPITLASIFAYMSAGAGAVVLHELLDTVKAVPGIGPLWVSVIAIIESSLGGTKDPMLIDKK